MYRYIWNNNKNFGARRRLLFRWSRTRGKIDDEARVRHATNTGSKILVVDDKNNTSKGEKSQKLFI